MVRHSFGVPEIAIDLPDGMSVQQSLFDFHAESESAGYYCFSSPACVGVSSVKKAGYFIMELGGWRENEVSEIKINGNDFAFFEAVSYDEIKKSDVVRAVFVTTRTTGAVLASVFYCRQSDYGAMLPVFRQCMQTFCTDGLGGFAWTAQPQRFDDKLFKITLSDEFGQESSLLADGIFTAANCCGVKIFMEYVRFVAVTDELLTKEITSVFDYEKWLQARKMPLPEFKVARLSCGQALKSEENLSIGSYRVHGDNYVLMGKSGFFALRAYYPLGLENDYRDFLRAAAHSVRLTDDDVRGFSDEGMSRLALPGDKNPFS